MHGPWHEGPSRKRRLHSIELVIAVVDARVTAVVINSSATAARRVTRTMRRRAGRGSTACRRMTLHTRRTASFGVATSGLARTLSSCGVIDFVRVQLGMVRVQPAPHAMSITGTRVLVTAVRLLTSRLALAARGFEIDRSALLCATSALLCRGERHDDATVWKLPSAGGPRKTAVAKSALPGS